MTERGKTKKELLQEIEELRMRLSEAEETLTAIQRGEVDAIVGPSSEGGRIYTLQGAEQPYRVFFEAMTEGAVTMDLDGAILYCNRAFADLAKVPLEKATGMSFLDFVAEDSRQTVKASLSAAGRKNRSFETSLKPREGADVPVNLSFNLLTTADMEAVCAIVTDLSDLVLMKRLEQTNEKLNAVNTELRLSQKDLLSSQQALRDARTAALNLMRDAVDAREKTERANEKLNQEIAERKRAEEEIKKHVAELRAANEELARFNRAAVDRELRMIELKKEVNELCSEAGKSPKYSLDFEKEE